MLHNLKDLIKTDLDLRDDPILLESDEVLAIYVDSLRNFQNDEVRRRVTVHLKSKPDPLHFYETKKG